MMQAVVVKTVEKQTLSLESIEKAKVALFQLLGVDITATLNDPAVQELMINRHDAIYIERGGEITKSNLKTSPEVLSQAITLIANINDKKTNAKILDSSLPGLRIAAVRTPIAIHGDCLSIRKAGALNLTMQTHLDRGAFKPSIDVPSHLLSKPDLVKVLGGNKAVLAYFKWMISARVNFIVSGGTSSGKTSFLNSLLLLMADINPERRLFTIEDTAELQVPLKNCVSFVTNEEHDVSARDLNKAALRMRPDSILYGEVRDGTAYDLMEAYSTGHPGSGVSFHADSAVESLTRLESMIRMCEEGRSLDRDDLRSRIATTFGVIIYCARVSRSRGPIEVLELLGAEGGQYQTRTVFKKEINYV